MSPRPVEPIVWPNTAQYKRALRRPDLAFHDPELQTVELDTDLMGTPASVEGQSAVVFFGRIGEQRITIRCLKRPVAFGERRYGSLRGFLAGWPESPFASVDWQSNGVLVADRRWPIVRMDHVQGTSLRQFIDRSLQAGDGLELLSRRWRTLAEQLREHQIAHSDLQQDNVRVLDDGSLRLIDLDAVWAPPLAEMPPKEVGHRHFQHPERLRTGYWDAGVDAFSALVIYVSLRAIAADRALWEDYHNDENLVFTDVDFENPGRTAIWFRLAASRDLEVRDLVALLEQFCRQTVRIDADLGSILRHRTLPGGEIYLVSGEPLNRAWWPTASNPTEPERPESGLSGAERSGSEAVATVMQGPDSEAADRMEATAGRPSNSPVEWAAADPPPVVDQWAYADPTVPAPAPVPAMVRMPSTYPAGRSSNIRARIAIAVVAVIVLLVLIAAL
jgi:hypothetical protein